MQDQKPNVEPTRDPLNESTSDLPPAYDALSFPHSVNHSANHSTSTSTFPGPSSDPYAVTPSLPKNDSPTLAHRPRARNRKKNSWLSFLSSVSRSSAQRIPQPVPSPRASPEQVRQSVVSIVSDLVVPPTRVSNEGQKDVHEILASVAKTCAEHKLSLCTILQETFIAGHTPMYWAIVNYRQELLVALLVHSRPLSIRTISDIRRACLVDSNQALFHALRVCRPPFHRTDGIRVPGLGAGMFHLLASLSKEFR